MPINRIPKSKRKGWRSLKGGGGDDGDGGSGEEDLPSIAPTLAMELFQSVQPLTETPRTEEEKREVYLTIIRLRMHGKTQKEIGELLHISERTVRNYMADELYSQVQYDLESEAKQNSHLLVSDLAYK